MNIHIPVLLKPVLQYWLTKKDGIYVDATFGFGGHTKQLLKLLDEKAQIFGLDVDQEAIREGQKLAQENAKFKMLKLNFENLRDFWTKQKLPLIDGILFDFGVSSYQLDTEERGFSYHHDAKLDMRLDQEQSLNAYEIVNYYSKDELIKIFSQYGEAKNSFNVASGIIKSRKDKKIQTTLELVEIIKKNINPKFLYQKKHPARIYFQAIRIAVNNELQVIQRMLNNLYDLLNKNGRALFITFHSLEEKIVKNWIVKNSKQINLKGSPILFDNKFKLLTKKPIVPNEEELEENRRSKSAKLWIVEKIN